MREPNKCVPVSEVVATGRWSECDKITTRTGTILNRTWAYHRSSDFRAILCGAAAANDNMYSESGRYEISRLTTCFRMDSI